MYHNSCANTHLMTSQIWKCEWLRRQKNPPACLSSGTFLLTSFLWNKKTHLMTSQIWKCEWLRRQKNPPECLSSGTFLLTSFPWNKKILNLYLRWYIWKNVCKETVKTYVSVKRCWRQVKHFGYFLNVPIKPWPCFQSISHIFQKLGCRSHFCPHPAKIWGYKHAWKNRVKA